LVVGPAPFGVELAQRCEPRRILQKGVPRDLGVGHRLARRGHIVREAHLRDPKEVFLAGMQLDISGLELLEEVASNVHGDTLRHVRPFAQPAVAVSRRYAAPPAHSAAPLSTPSTAAGALSKSPLAARAAPRSEGPMPDASTALAQKIAQTIAAEIGADASQVKAAVAL